MALYREGKAAMAADGTVTGTGTKWQSSLSLIRPGATIMFLSSPIQMAVVNKVVSDTEIKAITTSGAVVASTDYAILLSDSLTVDGLAQDVAETLRYYQSQETVIAEAVEFFKDFDLNALQELSDKVRADAEASATNAAAAEASKNAAEASKNAAASSQSAAALSQAAAAASQSGAEATRDEIQQIINDAGEQSTLVTLAQPAGANKIGAEKGGKVEDYLFDISIDALGDFKNDQDGLEVALSEKIEELTGMVDSAYVQGMENFCSVRFPNGNFTLKEWVLPPGVDLHIPPFARIRPHPDGEWAIKTLDTAGVPSWQRLMYSNIYGGVFGDRWAETGDMPEGKGGISTKFASYVRLKDTKFRYLKGMAFYGGEVFDMAFDNVSIIYCGYKPASGDPIPCFKLDDAGGTDASNACRFVNFHLEANRVGMVLNKCRHINFTNPKIERDETSHLLQGCQGVNFTDAILSFNSNDIPQFYISEVTGTKPSDSRGVSFNAPKCISSSVGKGWYFHNEGNASPLDINNHFASGIKRLVTGRRWRINGGTAYDSGPTMAIGDSNATIDNVEWRMLKPVTIGDGTDDTVIFKGTGCFVINSKMESNAGSSTDGGAFINTAATTDTIVENVTFGGYRQYGTRGAISNDIRDNKIDPANAHVGSLTNQASSNYTLTNKNKTGLGIGSINSGVYNIASGASLSPVLVAGCSKFLIRVIVNNVAAAAEFIADSSIAGLGVGPVLNSSLLSFVAGSAGDGLVHVTKPGTGGSVTITNNTAYSATVVLLAITAHSF